jgi:hypothetical protein
MPTNAHSSFTLDCRRLRSWTRDELGPSGQLLGCSANAPVGQCSQNCGSSLPLALATISLSQRKREINLLRNDIYIYMCNTQTEMPLTNVYLWRSTTLLRNTRSAAKINSSPTLGSVRIGCDHRICCPTAVTVVRERYWTSSWITALGEEAHTTRSSNP